MQPKIIYKPNILYHIFHQSCKTSQRSEDSCVVTPGFRQLFSILFLSRFHPLLSLQRYDYFMCVSLSLCVCSTCCINWNLQRLIQHLVCSEMFQSSINCISRSRTHRMLQERIKSLQQALTTGSALWSHHWPLLSDFRRWYLAICNAMVLQDTKDWFTVLVHHKESLRMH